MTKHELDWSKSAAIMVLEEFIARIKNRAEILHRIDYLEVEFEQVSPKLNLYIACILLVVLSDSLTI